MAEETRRRIMFYDEDLKEWVVAMFEEQIQQNDIESSEKKNQDSILPFSHAAL